MHAKERGRASTRSVEQSQTAAPGRRDRRASLASLAALVLALLVKWPQRAFTHKEPDEIIYWQLAQRLWQDGVYSLRGTRILEYLPASMYDHPLFHHPPLLPLLLGPWAASDAGPYPPAATMWVLWLAHGVFAAAVVALGLRLARRRANVFALVLVVLMAALDPFGWFASRFLWIDALSLACAALAAALGYGARSRARLALAGLMAGLAALSKLTGFVVLPFLVYDLVRRSPPRGALAALLVPPLVLVGSWLAVFVWHTGALLPTWIAPDEQILERDALMRTGFLRSPLEYLWLVPIVQPLAVWVAAAWSTSSKDVRREHRPLVAWLLVGGFAIAATTWLGTTPVQTRQLAPVLPALYVLAAIALVEHRALAWRLAFAVCVALAAANAAVSVHGEHVYELAPLWS